MTRREKIITEQKDTVAAILLVFVALLIKESITVFGELGGRLGAFNFSTTWTFLAIFLYWSNIFRISLGFARYLEKGNSGYMMGGINCFFAVLGLIISYLSVAFLSKNCWVTDIVECLTGNIKVSWAFYYLLPNLSYVIWDFYLYNRKNSIDIIERSRLKIWGRLDGLVLLILFFILFVPIAPDSPSAPIWLAIGTTLIIVSVDFTRNRAYYFKINTTEFAI